VSDVLVWRLEPAQLVIASAPVGGGIGMRDWILNAQVPKDYSRVDLSAHVAELAASQGCRGNGVGMLTAANLEKVSLASEAGVEVHATVGITAPTWAAAEGASEAAYTPGTINIVAFLPVRLTDAALVNAVMTVTEAKTQALLDAGIPGTGTASDAVCIVSPPDGESAPFGGPRSEVGAPLARAVYTAVRSRLP